MNNQNETHKQLNSLQEFNFSKTAVLAGLVQTGELVALRPVCENLGLSWSGAYGKINRDPQLVQLCVPGRVIAKDGKSYEMICMRPADFQNWLWSLNPTEKMDTTLWEEYKKGLVVYLLTMLKISLDEVQRLRHIENEFSLFKAEVLEYIKENNTGKEHTKIAKEHFKNAQSKERKIVERMEGLNLSQLRLL